MFTQIPGPTKHFNAYYQDNSLLIQFVIMEFLNVHQFVCHIQKWMDHQHFPPGKIDYSISPLLHLLNQLLGTHPNQEHITISKWIKGPLTKMKDYCEQFSKNPSLTPSHLKLYDSVYQTWHLANHQMNLLHTFQLCQMVKAKVTFPPYFQRSFKQLLKLFNVTAKQIPKVANLYWNNENVVYFLIRKKEQLVKVYGEEWTYKHFKSFAKQNTLLPLLIQRYEQRGFHYLNLEKRQMLQKGM
ncbi:hypothetical protein [Candidatus Protochlamydia sp. W-9]|uniref:hypothetical protein n=1 Tax=Candidatus Protochlamydia sp. W-9 TaxID=1785087 RepID=UPI00096A6152|nr:hypothetical protein [Candidatus Protochlamydia sp. W-9]